MGITISEQTSYLRKIPGIGQYLGTALDKLEQGINQLATNLGGDASGTIPAPPPIQGLTVKTNGTGLVHAVINDSNKINRNLSYFVEYDTSPAFSQPHVVHLGASRSMSPITLPAMNDSSTPQNFYFRAYSQYPGSHPSAPIQFGGNGGAPPTPVNPGGSQQLTLLPSTGSGTASNSGQQAGQGWGKVLQRPHSD